MKTTSLNRYYFLLIFILLKTTGLFGQTSADIYQRIRKLEVCTTVLYVAAHPDDENTRLITWMSKEKLFRTAYISLTRGDGGQNLIGAELGVDLGLIRTRELMAARAIDGGEQYFSRAYDFGFSKTPDETLQTWEKDKVLEDLVYVIRKLKPDVIICRFPPDQRAGHGHHSSSAILAREAFDLASDPTKFPEQIKLLGTWKVKRLYWNTFNFGGNNTTNEQQAKLDVGSYNPLIGKSYGELSAESRSQHKSQGFGVPAQRGTQLEYFSPVAGDTTVTDIFQNTPSYWETLKNGKEITDKIKKIESTYNWTNPSLSLSALLELRAILLKLPDHHLKSQKLKELESIIIDCTGLWIAAYSNSELYSVRDTLHVNLQAIVRNYDSLQIKLIPDNANDSSILLSLNKQLISTKKIILKSPSTISQPYWLNTNHNKGTFNISDIAQTGQPWSSESVILHAKVILDNQFLDLDIPVTFKMTDPVKGELFHPLVISPSVTGNISEKVSVFNQLKKRAYKLKVRYNLASPDSVIIHCNNSNNKDWKTSLSDTTVFFSKKNEEIEIRFTIEPKRTAAPNNELTFSFSLKNGTTELMKSTKEITYNHIPPITWFPELKIKLEFSDIKIKAHQILYIKGAGDEVAPMLRQMGCTVDEVTGDILEEIPLEKYDAIVTGIRAYNTDERLPYFFDKIMKYVENGGNFIVQYNTNSNLHPIKFMAPFPYTISRNRVTEEDAEVSFTDSLLPILNTPNKLSPKDFEGWVQERGLYFASKLDSAYTNVFLMHDKGENPQEGSLILCNFGKGRYIYTGLSFFRQLPAGVTGAMRLFANLLGEDHQPEVTQPKK